MELVVYGDVARSYEYGAELLRLARNNPAIQFRGPYDNSQVQSILAGIDVLVVPSIWFEIGPLVTLEAFAAGVPVAASRLPNMQYQIRTGPTGCCLHPTMWRLLPACFNGSSMSSHSAPVSQQHQAGQDVDEEMGDITEVYRSAVHGRGAVVRDVGAGEWSSRMTDEYLEAHRSSLKTGEVVGDVC